MLTTSNFGLGSTSDSKQSSLRQSFTASAPGPRSREMKILRTPDAAFAAIEDFPYQPHYHQVTPDLRMHYIDEGPRDAPVVLMMHGEPSWSYLYRHMIGPVVAAGFRVVAPDLIGFGKSDKPAAKSEYSYARHVAWVRHWIEALDLTRITLV